MMPEMMLTKCLLRRDEGDASSPEPPPNDFAVELALGSVVLHGQAALSCRAQWCVNPMVSVEPAPDAPGRRHAAVCTLQWWSTPPAYPRARGKTSALTMLSPT
jgi:hypothetical protein